MLPLCSLCSKRMEKPLRKTASSAPRAGSWASSTAATMMVFRNRILSRKTSILAQLASERQPQNFLQGPGHAAFGIAGCHPPAALLHCFRCISHDIRKSRKFKHFQIIEVVADGHHLLSGYPVTFRPPAQGVTFGTSAVQNVEDAQVAMIILSLQNGDFTKEIGLGEPLLGLLHPADTAAIHRLDRLFDQRILKRRHILDKLRVGLDPPGNALD